MSVLLLETEVGAGAAGSSIGGMLVFCKGSPRAGGTETAGWSVASGATAKGESAAGFAANVAGGGLPNAPHIRLNAPVSESKTMTRLLP